MHIVGIDLAVGAQHQAIIANEQSRFISSIIRFRTHPADLDQLYARARQDLKADETLAVVMEATNIVWYPLTAYFLRRGATVYVVNPRLSADLGRFYHRYATSDRLTAKVLARLPLVVPDQLYPFVSSGADYLALQRACRELDRLTSQAAAIKNRLQSTDLLGWPDLKRRVFADPFCPPARWFRNHFYDPRSVIRAGVAGLRQAWRADEQAYNGDEDWITPLIALAEDVQSLYGDPPIFLDHTALAAEVSRSQRRLSVCETGAHYVRVSVTRPLYRKLHPSRYLETIKGVGQDGAAVYTAFIGLPRRFPDSRRFRGWHGMVPRSAQSGESESKGLRITQAGPNPIKKYSFLNADIARQWDPQIAAIYHDQMVNKGKHHTQAVCACATHLLDRVRIILTQDRPYELRDVDGTPVTPQEARAIVVDRYTVPRDVRQRTNKRARRQRAERRAERQDGRRRSHPR
jgi:transposase